jgi:hypothetical protein
MPPDAAAENNFEIEEFTWGIGSTVVTSLVNADGEVRLFIHTLYWYNTGVGSSSKFM